MKYILTLAIALIVSASAQAQFGIKTEKSPYSENYQISFTNDGWKTKQQLVAYQNGWRYTWLTSDRTQAEKQARMFKSYQQCINSNRREESVSNRLQGGLRGKLLKP